tara:strand:- start:1370 stop:1507 length:138 start_codon:yes stop_codon:yes gene_type:complete
MVQVVAADVEGEEDLLGYISDTPSTKQSNKKIERKFKKNNTYNCI